MIKVIDALFDIFNKAMLGKKIFILAGVFLGLFSVLLMSSNEYVDAYEIISNKSMEKSFPFIMMTVSIVMLSFVYLQSGGSDNINKNNSKVYDRLDRELVRSKNKYEESSLRLSRLEEKLEAYESNKGLDEEEKKKIIDGAIDQVSKEAIEEVFDHEATKLKEDIKESLSFDKLVASSNGVVLRLRREIDDLRLRSNVNLLLGMTITAGGLYLLWTTVSMVDASDLLKQLASEGNESDGKFLKNLLLPLIPRVMLVIFVEVFAYFFLRLYRDGLSEIKYFQNELTNVESKLAAVEFSYLTGNQEALKTALESLSSTERNFILEKGQTTVELEKAKSESELTRNIIKTIPSFFKSSNK